MLYKINGGKEVTLVTSIKMSILRWAGHLKPMDKSEFLREIIESKPEGIRNSG